MQGSKSVLGQTTTLFEIIPLGIWSTLSIFHRDKIAFILLTSWFLLKSILVIRVNSPDNFDELRISSNHFLETIVQLLCSVLKSRKFQTWCHISFGKVMWHLETYLDDAISQIDYFSLILDEKPNQCEFSLGRIFLGPVKTKTYFH